MMFIKKLLGRVGCHTFKLLALFDYRVKYTIISINEKKNFEYSDARFQGGGILLCEAPLLYLHLDYCFQLFHKSVKV